jgi:hypothetical protein
MPTQPADLPEFGPGALRLLWRSDSYDGFAAGVAMLEERTPVYLNTLEYGFERLKPEWEQLSSLLEKLCTDDEFENIWDRLERSHKTEMHHTLDRSFNIRAVPSLEFDQLLEDHRQWQLHAGLTSDYWYDEFGVPREMRNELWAGREYLNAHYYAVVPWKERESRLSSYSIVGTVTRTALRAPSALRSAPPADPRSDALKAYQATWKPGDAVQGGW